MLQRRTAGVKLAFVCFAAAMGLHGPALGAEGDSPETQHDDVLRLLDAWLDAQVAFDRVPAVSAGVVIGQDLVSSKGYGAIDATARSSATVREA